MSFYTFVCWLFAGGLNININIKLLTILRHSSPARTFWTSHRLLHFCGPY